MYIKVDFFDTNMFLLLLLLSSVVAEWPPNKCGPGVRNANNDIVLTTSDGSMVQEGECTLQETFQNVIYVHATRTYGPRTESKTDSSLKVTIDEATSVVVHNDRITLGPDSNACYFPTASSKALSFWLRIRSFKLMDLRKTMFGLSIMPLDGERFVECAKLELDTLYENNYLVTVGAKTSTGMQQTVHEISKTRRSTTNDPSTTILESRINRMEERLRRLQNTVTEYVESHDRLNLKTNEQHSQLKSSIVETHNRMETRDFSQAIIFVFFFFLLLVCGISYVRWKSREERRFHMP